MKTSVTKPQLIAVTIITLILLGAGISISGIFGEFSMGSNMHRVSKQGSFSTDIKGITEATSSQVVNLKNGEIYNFKTLKKQLNEYNYSTNSDTEVVIAAYLKWGLRFVDYIEGMFSIALYDAEKQQTYLIRDRFGKKPLYYVERADGLWFRQ